MQEHVAIVGAGQAGAALALRLRGGGFAGRITLFGAEAHPPYQRPPLSKKYLSGEWEAERLYLRAPSFWQQLEVNLRTGLTVSAIEPATRRLTAGGEEFHWDKLALTTGSRPRPVPPTFTDLQGVFELRTLKDTDRLKSAFASGRRLAVIGGGFVGLETAAVAVKAGLQVDVIEMASRILARVSCEQTSSFFRDLHESNGVRIREGRLVRRVAGTDRVTAVELDNNERLDSDLVLLGIGIVPETSLADAAGLAIRDGILVDHHGRTSAPLIWAAGDCASFSLHGEPTRLESVQNAIDQAEAVADDMLGRGAPYAPVPWFWSDQYDSKLQIVG
jgi:3-phenylpropionate/trans-cinnamate dioxygenase ferredoxin reductase subunit